MILCSSAASREGLLHCEEKPCGCACASTLTLASCVGALTLEVDRYPLVATNCMVAEPLPGRSSGGSAPC